MAKLWTFFTAVWFTQLIAILIFGSLNWYNPFEVVHPIFWFVLFVEFIIFLIIGTHYKKEISPEAITEDESETMNS